MVYDIVEGRKFYKLKLCCCSQDFCKAVAVRVALAVSSIGFMSLFSRIAIWTTDINHTATAMLAGSFGTLLGYGIVLIIQPVWTFICTCCTDEEKDMIPPKSRSQEANSSQQGNLCEICNRKLKARKSNKEEDNKKNNPLKINSFLTLMTKPTSIRNCSRLIIITGVIDIISVFLYCVAYIRYSRYTRNIDERGKIMNLYRVFSVFFS